MKSLYELGMSLHRRMVRTKRLPRPVISVGGLSLGGAGKTPVTAWLAGALARLGHRPVLLSRGYGRSGRGIERVEPEAMDAAARFGDEPTWLAQSTGLPVVVGQDRWKAGGWALERLEADCFLLDDGFQHWRLGRDLDLVVLDASLDPDAVRVVPWGGYREGLAALERADAVLLNRCNQAGPERLERWRGRLEGRRRLEAELRAAGDRAAWRGRRVALASAIGAPESFEKTVHELGCAVAGHLRLRDHRRLPDALLEPWARRMAAAGAEAILVTEKDWVKLDRAEAGGLPVAPVAVELVPLEPGRWRELLESVF